MEFLRREEVGGSGIPGSLCPPSWPLLGNRGQVAEPEGAPESCGLAAAVLMGLGRSLMNEQDNCNQEPIPHFSSAITKAVPKEKGANFEGSSASKLKVAHPHCLPATHQEICQNASAEKYFVTIHHVFSQLK